MQIANVKLSHCEAKFCRVWAKFGRVRRKTEPTGPGAEAVIFFKIDTCDAVRMQIANVKLSHCEAKFCRVWAKFG